MATTDSTFVTVTLRSDLSEKLDRVTENTGASKNSLFVGLLAVMSDSEIEQKYQLAVELGLVKPRSKLTDDQRALASMVGKLSPARVKALLESLAEKPAGEGA